MPLTSVASRFILEGNEGTQRIRIALVRGESDQAGLQMPHQPGQPRIRHDKFSLAGC